MKEKPLLPKVNIGKHEAGTAEAGGTRPPETLEEESRLEKFLSDVERRIREATLGSGEKAKDGATEVRAAAEDAGATQSQIAEFARRAKGSGARLIEKTGAAAKKAGAAVAKLFGEGHAKKKAVSTSEGPKRIDKILDLDLGAESAQPAAEAPVPESVGKVVMSETERAPEVVPTPAEKKSELLDLRSQRNELQKLFTEGRISEEDYYVRDDEIMQEAAKLQEKGSISEAELEQFSKEALTALKSPVETAPAEVKQAVAETEIGEKPSAELYAVELPPAKTLEEQADEAARRLLSEIDTGLSYQPRRAEEILRAYGFRDTELQGKSPNELYAIIREKLASRSEARPETEAGEVPLAQEGAPGVVKKEQKQVVVEDKEAERAKQIAREILSATDKGGVPAFISKKLEHVLLTLGVATEDEVKKGRPEDLIARLKVAMSEGGQPAGQKTEAKPAEGIVAEKEPVLTEGGVGAKEKAGDKEKAKKEKVPETPEEREERKKYEALEKNLGEERAKYAELSRKIKKLEGSKKPEERAEAEKLKTGLEAAQKEYLEARKQEFEYKLSFFEKEADGKIKAGEFAAEEKEAEIKKFTTFGLVGEFKQLYDTKTALEIEENKKLHKYREKIYDFVNWYGKVDWKKKVVISVAVGSLSGGAGIAALRVMSGASLAVALEKGMRKGHEQKIAKELEHLIGSKIGEAMEKIEKGKVAEGLAQFLKSEDAAMLKEFESSEASLREKERRLKQRRWLFAGAAGLVVGSGASALAIRNVADMTGIHPVDYLSGKLELKQRLGATYDFLRSAWEKEHSGVKRAGAAVHKGAAAKLAVEAAAVKHEIPTGAKLASHLEAVAKESHNVATIEKGGNIWKAAHSFVGRALNEEQFRHAWAHSTVEINGIKVPINEVGLSHAHDQIIFTPDAQGGHFEVVNYAKNLRLGTNEDLYKAFVKGHKPVPDWLLKATGHKQLIVGKLAEHGAAVGAHPTAEVPVTHPTGAEAAHASGVGTISPDEMAARIAHAPNMKAGIDQYFEYARKFTDWHDHLNSLEKFQAAHTLDSASQKYFEDKISQEIADKFTHGSFSEQQQMYEGMLRFLVRSSDPSLKDWCSHLIGNFAKDPSCAPELRIRIGEEWNLWRLLPKFHEVAPQTEMTAPGAEAAPVLHAEAAAEAVRGIAPAQRAAIDNYLNGVFSKSQSIVDVANQMKSAEAHKLSGEALAYFEANIQNHMEGEFSHASFSEQSQTVDGLAKLVKKTSNHALKNWYEAMLNDTENTPLFRARVEYLQTEILDKIKVTDKVGMTLQDYDAIKHMKVGKLLGHHFLHSAKNFLKSSSSVIDFGQPQVYGTGYGGGMFYRGFMGGRMGIGGSLYGGWGGPYGYGIGPRVEDVQNYKEGIFEAALRETVKRTGMPWSVAKECAVGEVVGDVVDKNVPMPTM